MKRIFLLILLISFSVIIKAQKHSEYIYVDRLMLQINDSSIYSTHDIASYINKKIFTQKEKARAIFIWVAENIEYDYKNMYSDSSLNSDEILKNRKGVCRDYIRLYAEIAKKVGLKTYNITGYTRKMKRINYDMHAWCAVMLDSMWYFIDPTWGSGYLKNNRYVKEVNNDYFMVKPGRFIKTHIPFDPLWQFSNYPITKLEFQNRKWKSKNKEVFFNFIDTLKRYDHQTEIERLLNTAYRIKNNGISSYIDYYNLNQLKIRIKNIYDRKAVEQYNIALKYFNDAIILSNKYITYRNKYYLPYKSDANIKQMLNDIEDSLILSQNQLKLIKNKSSSLKVNIDYLNRFINIELNDLNETKKKLKEYLKVAKVYRQSLSQKEEVNSIKD